MPNFNSSSQYLRGNNNDSQSTHTGNSDQFETAAWITFGAGACVALGTGVVIRNYIKKTFKTATEFDASGLGALFSFAILQVFSLPLDIYYGTGANEYDSNFSEHAPTVSGQADDFSS